MKDGILQFVLISRFTAELFTFEARVIAVRESDTSDLNFVAAELCGAIAECSGYCGILEIISSSWLKLSRLLQQFRTRWICGTLDDATIISALFNIQNYKLKDNKIF